MGFKRPGPEKQSNDLTQWADIERFNLDVTYKLILEAEELTRRGSEAKGRAGTSGAGVIEPLDELHTARPKGSVRALPRIRMARRKGQQ